MELRWIPEDILGLIDDPEYLDLMGITVAAVAMLQLVGAISVHSS